ncbi:MAG TPA: hypothetical protein VIV60_06760 [Polyangiaceae bacterium]
MSRLFAPSASTTRDVGQRLLHSMHGDAPTPEAKANLRRVLGLSAVAGFAVTTTTATAAAAATSTKVSGVAATSGKVAVLAASSLFKTSVMGAVVGVLIGAAAVGTSVAVQRGNSQNVGNFRSPVTARGRRQTTVREQTRPNHQPEERRSADDVDVDDAARTVSRGNVGNLGVQPNSTTRNRAPEPSRRKDESKLEKKYQGDAGQTPETTTAIESSEALPALAELGDTPKTSASALTSETSQLAKVRAALHEGDAARGLAGLESYEREFEAGVLRPEAAMLRIEALMRVGKLTLAREHANRFLSRYPTSPHVGRVRQLVGL